MRHALAIAVSLLALESFAGFQSAYCDTGDFPINNWMTNSVLQPKMQDKNAIVALAAGLGELDRGMRMRFGGDPTQDSSHLCPYSNLVAQCKGGTMTRETLPHGIFPAMIYELKKIKSANYYQPYTNGVTNITILGVSPFMNDFGVNTAYARDLVNDVRYEYYSNLRTHNNVDYALFREVGARTPYPASRYGRAPTMYDAIHDEYVRVFGSGAATKVTASGFCCEDFVTSYNCPTESWLDPSYTARQCAWWRNGILDSGMEAKAAFAWRQLYYSPKTAWNSLGPQNFGMVYRWCGELVGVVTTTRVWKAYCDVDVTYTPRLSTHGFITGATIDYSSHNTSNAVQYAVETNWCYGSGLDYGVAHLENWSKLDFSDAALGVLWDSTSPYTNQYGVVLRNLTTASEKYTITTNGHEYAVYDLGYLPTLSNRTDAVKTKLVEVLSYTTVRSGIIHAPYDSDFPVCEADWNDMRVSSIAKVDVSGENWNGDDVSSSKSTSYNKWLPPIGYGTLHAIAIDFIPNIRYRFEQELSNLAENCDASPVWDEIEGLVDYDAVPSAERGDKIWWVEGAEEAPSVYSWTTDFVTFNDARDPKQCPSFPGSIDIPIYPSSYPSDHECEMALKMAVFGFWRFTRWAHK